jgi:hypothetical protein
MQRLVLMLQGCAEANYNSFVVFHDESIYFHDDDALELSTILELKSKYMNIKRSLYTGPFAIFE